MLLANRCGYLKQILIMKLFDYQEELEVDFSNAIELLEKNLNDENKEEFLNAISILKDFSEEHSLKHKQDKLIKRALDMLERGEKITNGESNYVGYVKNSKKYYSFSSWDKTLVEVEYKEVKRHVIQDMLECNREFY